MVQRYKCGWCGCEIVGKRWFAKLTWQSKELKQNITKYFHCKRCWRGWSKREPLEEIEMDEKPKRGKKNEE